MQASSALASCTAYSRSVVSWLFAGSKTCTANQSVTTCTSPISNWLYDVEFVVIIWVVMSVTPVCFWGYLTSHSTAHPKHGCSGSHCPHLQQRWAHWWPHLCEVKRYRELEGLTLHRLWSTHSAVRVRNSWVRQKTEAVSAVHCLANSLVLRSWQLRLLLARSAARQKSLNERATSARPATASAFLRSHLSHPENQRHIPANSTRVRKLSAREWSISSGLCPIPTTFWQPDISRLASICSTRLFSVKWAGQVSLGWRPPWPDRSTPLLSKMERSWSTSTRSTWKPVGGSG